MTTNKTTKITDEYDTELLGLHENYFKSLHIAALICISISLVSNISVVVLLFKRKKIKTFFTWTKSERCLMYIAIANGFFVCIFFMNLNYLFIYLSLSMMFE